MSWWSNVARNLPLRRVLGPTIHHVASLCPSLVHFFAPLYLPHFSVRCRLPAALSLGTVREVGQPGCDLAVAINNPFAGKASYLHLRATHPISPTDVMEAHCVSTHCLPTCGRKLAAMHRVPNHPSLVAADHLADHVTENRRTSEQRVVTISTNAPTPTFLSLQDCLAGNVPTRSYPSRLGWKY